MVRVKTIGMWSNKVALFIMLAYDKHILRLSGYVVIMISLGKMGWVKAAYRSMEFTFPDKNKSF